MSQHDMFSAREFVKLNKANSKKSKPVKHEEKVQMRLCEYVRVKYPNVIFECDLASGTRLTIGQAVKHKAMRSNRGMPDFRIFHRNDAFYGLFLELKKDGENIHCMRDGKKIVKGDYKVRKKGDWSDIHIEEQAKVLSALNKQGYWAEFAIGFNEAVRQVDTYLDFSTK